MEHKNDKGLKQRRIMLWDDGHQRKRSAPGEREREVTRKRRGLRLLHSAAPKSQARPTGPLEDAEAGFLKQWRQAILHQTQKGEDLEEAKETVEAYLSANPDLGGNRFKADLLIFFLKNYINTDPEFAGIPFRERLNHAEVMARNFIRHTPV